MIPSALPRLMTAFFLVSSLAAPAARAQETAPAAEPERRPRVGQINPAEKDKYSTRYETKYSRTFSFGPAWVSNLNQKDMVYGLTIGGEWEVGAQGAVIAQGIGAFGTGVGFASAVIGGKYFFSDEDVSPMIKGGFGFGGADGRNTDDAEIKWVDGFALNVGAGVTLFRTSTVHMEIGGEYVVILKDNGEGNPGMAAVTLGIQY